MKHVDGCSSRPTDFVRMPAAETLASGNDLRGQFAPLLAPKFSALALGQKSEQICFRTD